MAIYKVCGTVADSAAAPIARRVAMFKRSTFELIGSTESDVSGEFEIFSGTDDSTFIVALPELAEAGNAKIFDKVIPEVFTLVDAAENDIGIPGTQGFGVGVCPSLPMGFEALGTFDTTSDEYGNYRHTSDGSIMVWIPAFFYKWGTGSNGLSLNEVDIKPLDAYADVATANAAGYAMHRAFYDGGVLKDGFFIDKYLNSVNPSTVTPSSIRGAPTMSFTTGSENLDALGTTDNYLTSAIDAAKLRGTNFFPVSIFMIGAIKMLAYAHAQESASTTFCAWYDAGFNYPKGAVSNGGHPRSSDMVSLGYSSRWMSGVSNIEGITSHNGQTCGMFDIGGLLAFPVFGVMYETSNFRALKKSVAMKDLTSGNSSATDIHGTSSHTNVYDTIGSNFGATVTGLNSYKYPDLSAQFFSESTTETDEEYLATCSWVYIDGGETTSNTFQLGSGVYVSKTNTAIFSSGAAYNSGTLEQRGFYGIWMSNSRFTGGNTYGMYCGYYI